VTPNVKNPWSKKDTVEILREIPIEIFMKLFEARERQGRYLREMPRRLV
jgi:hypothetical protein